LTPVWVGVLPIPRESHTATVADRVDIAMSPAGDTIVRPGANLIETTRQLQFDRRTVRRHVLAGRKPTDDR
jgi:hypothetical protein